MHELEHDYSIVDVEEAFFLVEAWDDAQREANRRAQKGEG